MKWFVIILLSLNVCYFGWELDRQTQMMTGHSVQPFYAPADAQYLRLWQEIEEDTVTDVGGDGGEHTKEKVVKTTDEKKSMLRNITSMMGEGDVIIRKKIMDELAINLSDLSILSKPATGSKEPLCFSFGPFAEEQQVGDLISWFRSNGIDTGQRFDSSKQDQHFWMYLAIDQSEDQAKQAIETLEGRGIRNYQLINRGSFRNAVSLGLLSNQSEINQRLKELKNIGYRPIVVPYQEGLPIIWVDAKIDGDENTLSSMLNGYLAQFNSIPFACKDFVSGG